MLLDISTKIFQKIHLLRDAALDAEDELLFEF